MTKPSIGLQDLRRRIYLKAKADQKWRFWGLYVHVCKPETLREAYEMARRNGGAAGIDGVTFAAIEEAGLEAFLDDIHDELHSRTYRPSANRQVEIPKDGGKVRILGIPTIRDRVVQGALKLILEPVFEADFQEGLLRVPAKTHGPSGGAPGDDGGRKEQDHGDRRGLGVVFRYGSTRHPAWKSGDSGRRRRSFTAVEAHPQGWRQAGRSPGWGYFTLAQQSLSQRGGQDAGAGEGRHPTRTLPLHRVCSIRR